MPIKSDREYRRIDLSNLETREEEDGQMVVEGYATTFNDPYFLRRDGQFSVYEEIDSRAFDDTDMTDVIMQYDHQGRVFARNKNGTLDIVPDEHGLKIKAVLGGTSIGRQLYEEIKGGYTDKMSFGFTVANDERIKERNADTDETIIKRRILAVKKLYDVSAVSLPANDATEISARNFSEGVIAEVKKEFLAEEERKQTIQRIRLKLGVNKE